MGKNTFLLSQEGNVLRVAAYCRISTRHTDRFGSLKQQQAHFEKVIEKSLSRLGRDTLETIRLIRRLRSVGIGVYSEVEKINTLLTND